MNVKEIITVAYDENGDTVVNIPDHEDAVLAVSDYIHKKLLEKNQEPLNVLFSIVVHFLAKELTGKFEKEFIQGIRETTPTYREGYRKMREQLLKPKN